MANALIKIDDRGLKTPIDLLDNEKIRFGTGNDLELYHDGSHSHIVSNTGNLRILADGAGELVLTSKTGEEAIVCAQDGSVELMYDNSKKFETTSDGWKCTDSVKGVFGTGNDLSLYHDGSHSYIQNNTGELKLNANLFRFRNSAGNENIIYGVEGGSVELFYDNVKHFETISGGIRVQGTE